MEWLITTRKLKSLRKMELHMHFEGSLEDLLC